MARKPVTQWEFPGELFGASKPTRDVLGVTDFTTRVKELLEGRFPSLLVKGEVSNYRLQPSGHAYFVLKDAGAALACVLFRGQAAAARGLLRDGASVILGGQVTVYEARGQYQLRVTTVEAEGIGALQVAFEELKRRLAAEGLFDAARKRPIPRFPRGVGIVTSATAAALQDVLHVLQRRYAGLDLWLAPARVQGQGAAREIASAIGDLNRWRERGAPMDVILVTRGGGSLEDLWAFNEEVVARAIAASALPVVSAVGHEIDFTLSDFVADLRAATPSAAAELLTEAYVERRLYVEHLSERLPRLARGAVMAWAGTATDLARRISRLHPRRRIEAQSQRLDDAIEALRVATAREMRDARRRVAVAGQRLKTTRPGMRLTRETRGVEETKRRLVAGMAQQVAMRGERLGRLAERLRLLSPLSVLDRGYSITLDAETGAVVRNAGEVKPGRRLVTRLRDGRVRSVATGGETDAGTDSAPPRSAAGPAASEEAR